MIAALYVEPRGCYSDLPDVDVWGIEGTRYRRLRRRLRAAGVSTRDADMLRIYKRVMRPHERDARRYRGSMPVVAHPPCGRWCRMSAMVEATSGYVRGDDAGCFAHALATVRRCGGVLEHPAFSAAWAAFGLLSPPSGGGLDAR